MNDKELRLLKETLAFVKEYDQNKAFRSDINQKMATGQNFQGRPIFLYVQVLLIYSDVFRRNYLKLTQTSSKLGIKSLIKKEPTTIEKFLLSCIWEYGQEYSRLRNIASPPGYVSEDELDEFERLRQMPDSPKKEDAIQALANKALSRKVEAEQPQSVDQIASKIEDPEKIEESHKEKAALVLEEKIRKYEPYLINPANRERLIREKVFTAAEIKEILRSGLVKVPDVIPEYNSGEFQSVSQRQQALREAAGRLLKSRVEERIAGQKQALDEEIQKAISKDIKSTIAYRTHPKHSSEEDLKKLDELMGVKREVPQLVKQSGEPLPFTSPPPQEIPTPSPPKEAPLPSSQPAQKVSLRQRLSVLRQARLPEPAQKIFKDAASFGRRLIIRHAPTLVSAGIGGFVGVAGAGLRGGLVGVGTGALFPQLVKKGIAQGAAKGAAKLGAKVIFAATGPVGWGIALATSIPGVKKLPKYALKVAIALIAAIIFFPTFQDILKTTSIITPFGTGIARSAPYSGGSCPSLDTISANRQTTPETCQYLNPAINIFGDLTESQLSNYAEKYWQQSKMDKATFLSKVKTIAEKSRSVGLNPIIFLGYWKSESLFGNGFGCKQTDETFEKQLDCAVGLIPGGSRVMQCAGPKGPYKEKGCRDIKGIIMANADIYDKSLFNFDFSKSSYDPQKEPNPITTFDALAEGHGPKSPNLAREEKVKNMNCVHTYNELLEVANYLGACVPTAPRTDPSNMASCQFTKAGESKPYQSSKLLGYFQQVSGKTGVPAALLAGIVRVESTVGETNGRGQGPYSISDYTDSDIDYINRYNFPNTILTPSNSIEEINKIVSVIIPGTTKSICPVSSNNALGLMQIQPPGTDGHASGSVNKGAQFIGKTAGTLTLKDYCSIESNLTIGAGFILGKLETDKWNPKWTDDQTFLRELARRYYGAFTYGPKEGCKTESCYYGDDLYNSIQNCKQSGQPSYQASCPVTGGIISCASYGKPYTEGGGGGFSGSCRPDQTSNGGHCNVNYINAVGICRGSEGVIGRNGQLIRTAKSIDVSSSGISKPGDPVYLPTIKGQSLKWYYKGYLDAGRDFGKIRLFQSEPTSEGIWSIHFVHVAASDPPLTIGQELKSGVLGAKMIYQDTGTHVHVTVGLNVGDSLSDLKDYSPNWMFADRDLGMCVK